MNMLNAAVRELTGLFVDDGALALRIVAVVALGAISATVAPGYPLIAGGILLLGCLGVLFADAEKARRG
jgi:hypothetical protein